MRRSFDLIHDDYLLHATVSMSTEIICGGLCRAIVMSYDTAAYIDTARKMIRDAHHGPPDAIRFFFKVTFVTSQPMVARIQDMCRDPRVAVVGLEDGLVPENDHFKLGMVREGLCMQVYIQAC